MADKPPTIASLARKLCREFPDTPSRTLAKRLYAENNLRISTLHSARMAILEARGAKGKRDRHKADPECVRPKGQAGWVPACPPSAAEPWLAVKIDGPAKILSISDVHIPYHSKEAVEAAVAYGRKLKPDTVILLGDVMDFYGASRYQKDPKKRQLTEEIEDGKKFLQWIRSQFTKQRVIYKLGNHDVRWDHLLWNKAPEICDLKDVQLHNVLEFEELGIERVDDNMILAGELPMLHGHELGKGISAPVNPARGAWLRGNHTALIGHYHRTSSHAETDLLQNEMMAWSQGCLCDRTPEYARINKWNWGFAWVDVAKSGQFNLHNCRISNDYQVRTA
jgi:predicted phosphodiesterase